MSHLLFYSSFHGFVHKTLVVAYECGLMGDIIRVPTFPFKNLSGEVVTGQYSIAALNPLDKVPTLVTDEGQIIYGSQAVCEYLDAHSKGARIFPEPGPARWDAITRMATGDSMFESIVQMGMETWLPREEWRIKLFDWLTPKIARTLDAMEAQVAGWSGFDIGHVALIQGISYLDCRSNCYQDGAFFERPYEWRADHPKLAAWYEAAIERPSVQYHFNKDYEGDGTPEFHAAMVQEALKRKAARVACKA